MPPLSPIVLPSVLDQTEVGPTNDQNDGNGSGSQVFEPLTQTPVHADHSVFQSFEPLMHIIDKIAEGQRVPPQTAMRYEMLRLHTLRSYPKEHKPFITRLAQAGFYYANSGDEVVCYSCGLRKGKWREDDKPMGIHRQLSPNCSFLLRNSEVNVPITSSDFLQNGDDQLLLQNLTGTDTTALTGTVTTALTGTETLALTGTETIALTGTETTALTGTETIALTGTVTTALTRTVTTALTSTVTTASTSTVTTALTGAVTTVSTSTVTTALTGAVTTATSIAALQNSSEMTTSGMNLTERSANAGTGTRTMPIFPKYATKTVRIRTFDKCSHIAIPPDSLADAGLFYTGSGDCVRCFHCGVGLRHLTEEDDPWIEHSRWSKDCSFVRAMKGKEFVNLVQMAVQYSQNQNQDEQCTGDTLTGTNQEGNGGERTEKLLLTDAAQSVLEMGYHYDLVRRAIRAVRESNDHQNFTAENLMEKIFEFEESESSESASGNEA